jgi:hypothetical protein
VHSGKPVKRKDAKTQRKQIELPPEHLQDQRSIH